MFLSRILQQNKIKTITKKAFDGLEELEHLWVKDLTQSMCVLLFYKRLLLLNEYKQHL